MIKVYGQIQTLKSIRATLNAHGLSEFASVGEINSFLLNYESQVRRVRDESELWVENEIKRLGIEKLQLEQQLDQVRENTISDISNESTSLQQQIDGYHLNSGRNTFQRLVSFFMSKVLQFRLRRLDASKWKRIDKSIAQVSSELNHVSTQLSKYVTNTSDVINQHYAPKIRKLNRTKDVLEQISPLVAGAVGESMVEEEVKKLSIHGVLLNDFSTNFNPPIYNKKENDRIFSVQIDHVLITRAGIFLLETKNWSKSSIERLDLRSPIDQIMRFNFALYVLVNKARRREIGIKVHHWGKTQIPIRNLIVMIGHKPKEQFQHVSIKTLSELNGYLEYFEPVFSEEDVDNIASYLRGLQQDHPAKYIQRTRTTTYVNPVFSKDHKSDKHKGKNMLAIITLLIIIFSSIGAILYFQSETSFQQDSFNAIQNNKPISTMNAANSFIAQEGCPTYSKPNIKSSIIGYLVPGNEVLVKDANQFKYFYQIPNKSGKKRYVRKECLEKK